MMKVVFSFFISVETKVKAIVVGERLPDYQHMALAKLDSGERCWVGRNVRVGMHLFI
jgi:hypothetical protein